MNLRNLAIFSICLILATVLGVVIGDNYKDKLQGMTIKSYEVPEDRAEEIRSSLNRLFANDRSDGRAEVVGGGSLVIKASDRYQHGISKLIEKLAKVKANPRAVNFEYWMVRAEIGSSGVRSPSLDSLKSTLDAITETQGPRQFKILEHLTFGTLNGRDVKIKGALTEVKAKPLFNAGAVDVELKVNTIASLGEIETTLNVKSGEYVVLGQTIMLPNARAVAEGKEAVQETKEIFHIIRAVVSK